MSDAGKCLRCGAQVAEGLGSCVEMYHMVLAREYSNALFASVHLYTADAYILQHSEEHGPRSNAFHLMRLCYLLEHDGSPATGGSNPPNRQQFETLYAQFPFLNPPAKRGALRSQICLARTIRSSIVSALRRGLNLYGMPGVSTTPGHAQ